MITYVQTSSDIEDASRIFCASSIRSLAAGSAVSVLEATRLASAFGSLELAKAPRVRDVLENVRELLLKHRPNEYVYKSVLLEKLVCKSFRPHTVAVFNELRVAKSRADLVLVRELGTVYEVKTGLDDLSKAEKQIADYYSCFTHVNFVLDKRHIERAMDEFRPSVGVLSINRRQGLTVHRPSSENSSDLSNIAMFNSMLRAEYSKLLSRSGESTDLQDHSAVLEAIAGMDPVSVHKHYMKSLRLRGLSRPRLKDIPKLPSALLPAAYHYKMTMKEWESLVKVLDTDVTNVIERAS